MAAESAIVAHRITARFSGHSARTIPVIAFGMGLSGFLVISYVLCVLGYMLFPGLPINHAALTIFSARFRPLVVVDVLPRLGRKLCLGLVRRADLRPALQLLPLAVAMSCSYL